MNLAVALGGINLSFHDQENQLIVGEDIVTFLMCDLFVLAVETG